MRCEMSAIEGEVDMKRRKAGITEPLSNHDL
jgi:hypothetical protein